MAVDAATLSRLRWRCRRGMRELDQLLCAWLERRAPLADAAELGAFEALLAAEDSELWAWLMGRAPAPAEHAALVDALRQPD